MRLISVNVGAALRLGDSLTGICKASRTGPIKITTLGVMGDAVCDKKFHGGPDQAVYVYGGEDYAYWANSNGLDLEPGTFGDNLTISELSSLSVYVGDRFQIDEVLLEATAPRIPCATLGQRMEDPKFPVAFRKSQRSGFYCRVIEEGILEAGSDVTHVPTTDSNPLSIVDMFELYYDPNPSRDSLEDALATPIAIRDRERLTARLEKLDA
ncbi:MAG: MOSC domain-containing protein [Gammaproteobacteria bacterium]|nr:MOSC domain-containing protein [Gammaproteobacteria bacterium]